MTETTDSTLFGADDFFRRGNYAPVADELAAYADEVNAALKG